MDISPITWEDNQGYSVQEILELIFIAIAQSKWNSSVIFKGNMAIA